MLSRTYIVQIRCVTILTSVVQVKIRPMQEHVIKTSNTPMCAIYVFKLLGLQLFINSYVIVYTFKQQNE